MIANIKCLGQLLIAIVSSVLILELCECKPDFGVEGIDSAGNVAIGNDKLTAAVEPPLIGQEVSPEGKRGWSNFNSWGKRGWNKNFAVWGKRRWNNFASWGKRDPSNELSSQNFAQIDPDKRGWSKFASWGKRADGDDMEGEIDKRKWSKFNTWGKRNKENFQDELDVDKKWSQFSSWGKRDDADEQMAEKRKWSQFNSWGKRNNLDNTDSQRKWSQFAAWGKRNAPDSEYYQEPAEIYPAEDTDGTLNIPVDKRRWSKFASWGKRLRNAKTLAALNSWRKRRWPGLVTWGKRSAGMVEPNTKEIAQKLLQFFDANGDGTLDITELASYLETLASLPSSKGAIQPELVEM